MRKITVKIGKPKPINANIEEPKDVEVALKDATLRQTSGTTNHDELTGRDLPNQHPMSSIEGLELALDEKQPIGNYALKEEIPSKTSELENDNEFITKTVSDLVNYYAKQETYSREEIDNKISSIPKFSIEVVDSLPTAGISETTVYLVPSGNEEDNLYTEYIYVNGVWEYLGKQTVDLTGYVKRTELSSYYTKTDIEALIETVRSSIPTKLSQLTEDASHRLVSDSEKQSWNNKQPAGDYALKSEIPNVSGYATTAQLNTHANDSTKHITSAERTKWNSVSDNVEILLPSEVVAVVGVEFNVYYKSVIRANKSLENFEIKCSLNNTSIPYKLLKECFRLTATDSNVGDYTLTIQVKDVITGTVKAEKTTTLHIIKNRTLNTKNVLYIGDSLTASRGGLYASEIQYNLSNGKLVSIGSQNGSAETNQVGAVKHEGYNGATVGGFLDATVTSGNTNKFYNPAYGTFDLDYFMSNQGYTQLDAVMLNLGHNNIGNHVNAVNGLKTMISKIHEYNPDIPVIVSLIEPLAGQDGWSVKTKSTAEEMNRHWKNLISAYITAFDNNVINNVYLSTPYLNIDADNDFPTETVARCSRDTTQIVRQNDAMHPSRVGNLKMADAYFASLMYRIPEDDAIYHTVTKNLTNVTINNSAGSVKEGTSYSATLTPADGYVLKSVTVTMGGNPVTVTNGVINIAGVTGDIVITATAELYVPSYNNLAKPSTANDSAPNTALTADEWLNNHYISSKKISAKDDLAVTNKIPFTYTDTIRIKGFSDTGVINGSNCSTRFRLLPCDASGNALISEIYPAMTQAQQTTGYKDYMDTTELANGVYCFKPSALPKYSEYWTNVAFVRIAGYPIDGDNSNVIVTVNEPIE